MTLKGGNQRLPTIHHPDNVQEVRRVINIVKQLDGIGIKSGINLLVGKCNVDKAKDVYEIIM